MSSVLDPKVDQWLIHLDKGQRFIVTAIDEQEDSIEVQHFDSDLEEFTQDEWRGRNIELSEAPENWNGALDIGE